MGGLLLPSQYANASISELTGIIGTSYYISPEIANGWASYDDKVWTVLATRSRNSAIS